VFADGDNGHGNATNVIRTMKEFERAGVSAIFFEDQVKPKRCGHMSGKQVIPIDEMVAKIRAAVDARVDGDLSIMARTDVLAVNGMDDAIERMHRVSRSRRGFVFCRVTAIDRRDAPHYTGDSRAEYGQYGAWRPDADSPREAFEGAWICSGGLSYDVDLRDCLGGPEGIGTSSAE
jgi:hypothetical protein